MAKVKRPRKDGKLFKSIEADAATGMDSAAIRAKYAVYFPDTYQRNTRGGHKAGDKREGDGLQQWLNSLKQKFGPNANKPMPARLEKVEALYEVIGQLSGWGSTGDNWAELDS